MSDATDLTVVAEAWIAGDPDPDTAASLGAILAAGDDEALADHVDGTLTFGTAGIRGIVGPGPLRMNRAVVIRTTAGLADHLLATHGAGGTVVVGHDARPDSERFAADTCGVLVAAGFDVRAFDGHAPTPLVAFEARRLGAVAAVVITASHNPPAYNGYKVYDHRGVQIVAPTDTTIAAAIAAVGPAVEVPRVDGPRPADIGGVTPLRQEVFAAYRDAVLGARVAAPRAPLRIAHTPLHGVGGEPVRLVLEAAGYEVHQVASQVAPDGAFPTVTFPNPEEPGALDAVLALAAEVDVDVVIANDPDVDRLAVAVADGGGRWRALTGNEIGVLLTDFLLANGAGGSRLVVSSIVSTPWAAEIAAAHGARHEATLTGFKWICNAALDLEAEGWEPVLGFEEALGYAVGTLVRDKDGINAALTFADLAASLRAGDSSVAQHLDDLARRHGLWVSVPLSIVRDGPDGAGEIEAAMGRIGPGRAPDDLAGRVVVGVRDLRTGAVSRPRWLPADSVVEIALTGGRALVRPSGTEPKLKIYVDLRADVAGDVAPVRARLAEDAAAVAADLAAFLGLS